MNKLAEQIIINIIRYEMNLTDEQIWIRNQDRKIPIDKGLYVVVGFVDGDVIGNVNSVVPAVIQPVEDPPYNGMKEIQGVQMRENIQIDIFSRSNEAITRRWEILAALRSVYSQQQQEGNYFKIFRIPQNFVNSSDAEGGSMINRFSLVIPCFVWYYKEKVLSLPSGDFYNNFDTRVDDAQTIGEADGIIEFNITEETGA